MRNKTARLGPLPGNEEEKNADERPAYDPADHDRDEDRGHDDDEFLRVEPEDLNRPMQELWQTFIHALLPCFTTSLDVVSGR
jgi:hypothetical protein